MTRQPRLTTAAGGGLGREEGAVGGKWRARRSGRHRLEAFVLDGSAGRLGAGNADGGLRRRRPRSRRLRCVGSPSRSGSPSRPGGPRRLRSARGLGGVRSLRHGRDGGLQIASVPLLPRDRAEIAGILRVVSRLRGRRRSRGVADRFDLRLREGVGLAFHRRKHDAPAGDARRLSKQIDRAVLEHHPRDRLRGLGQQPDRRGQQNGENHCL